MFKKNLLFFLLFYAAYGHGKTIEIKKIDEIKPYLNKEHLIIFDIDNTLMEPVQELGNDQWFHHRIREYQKKGLDASNALERALPEWIAIQNITKVKPVETHIPPLLKGMQKEGYFVMALTTRGLGIATRTIEQLHMIGVDLSPTALTQEEKFFMNEQGVLFRKGILFTAGSHKGKALKKFLSMIEYKPKSILFINNKIDNIKEVESVFEEEKIPVTGLRYGFLDEKVQNFRIDLAEIQFDHFGHILSNEAAEAILENSKCLSSTK